MDESTADDALRAQRQHRQLRLVVATARAAVRQHEVQAVKARFRALQLVADLEQRVLQDGRDPGVLKAVAEARRELLP